MKILTMDELKIHAEENPVEWLVDDLLKEASFNIIAGGPKSGKSSLMRQLAAAVSKGEPFLGMPTKQGEVLYLCPDEQDTTELHQAFTRLGVTAGVYISAFPVNRYTLIPELRDALVERPEVSLLVLDTLEKTVEIEDLNDYSKTLRDLSPIVDFAVERGITTLASHHTNKRQSASVSGAMMGSNGIGSIATTSIEVLVDSGKRFLRTMQRYGPELERTELEFNKFKGVATLGQSDSSKAEQKQLFKKNELRGLLLNHIAQNPGAKQRDILSAVPGNTRHKIDELRTMKQRGLVEEHGTGRRGDAKIYYLAEIPVEKAA